MRCVINFFKEDEEREIVLDDLDDDFMCFIESNCFETILKDMIRTYSEKNCFLD